MKMIQWGLALFIVAVGGIASALVFLENGLAGTITALLVLICALPLLFAAKAAGRLDQDMKNGASLGVTAAILRQGRAISRLDDGEISGAGGRSL